MRAWLVLVAACSGATPEPRPAPIAPPPSPAAAQIAVPAPPPTPVAPVGRPAQPAAHANAITLLATTTDARTAVTSDLSRLIRLWPTLDGTREPLVVTGPMPTALAVVRAGDGFAIAIQDTGGTLHVERLTADGAQLPERAIESPLPYEQLEAMRGGFVALRADDTVELIAPDGTRHTIAPPPARITRLVVTGDDVLALAGGAGRFLVDGAWGPPTPPFAIDPAHAVLAPDRRRLAAAISDGGAVVEVDLVTGARRTLAPALHTPLGYIDANTLVTLSGNLYYWRGTPSHEVGTEKAPGMFAELTTALGDGRVVAAAGLQLELIEPGPGKPQYLGYDLVDPTPLHTTPVGLVARGDLPALVDEQLAVRPLFAKAHEGEWMDFTMLDDRHGVALVRDFSQDMEQRWCELWDLATTKRVQKLGADARLDALVWEPSTQLFATLSLDGGQLFHYADGKLSLAGALPGSPDRVFLLDPALAHGDIAIVVESGKASRLGPDLKVHGATAINDTLLAIDRGGRVIARRGSDLLLGDTRVPGLGAANIRVSPDLKRVVAFDAQHTALVDRDGTIRWSVASWGTRDAGWTADDELILSQGGLVRLDLATGQTIARRCGWAFGLSTTIHTGAPLGTSTCDP